MGHHGRFVRFYAPTMDHADNHKIIRKLNLKGATKIEIHIGLLTEE